ncbi:MULTISPECIES: PQQ-binding-like beta-propeller repeat protein [unclassified Pseudonocardia]|uniref:WD40 repeat domain-containing protein n=1 Tax=unclassified Pseudonocardia TaxID=2619320 RepID=UPI00094B786E|nr:PQQ-binding-like beta-propeller repeat protein [Pseudonocardia sp. Ae707_Ps1]OLM17496.1 High-affnity carbon uptake protein Hat/HatR [Pseudonocardia sp. Ae707_Ps1]
MPVEMFWDGLEQRVAGGALHDGAGDLTPPAGVSAAAVRRVLDLEAHHLRDPDLAGQAAGLPQQLLARAAVTGEDALAGAARARIESRGLSALATRWRTRPPSAALLRILDGHGDALTGLAVDPGGALLSVDASGGAVAWDPATGTPVAHPVTGPCGPERAAGPAPVLAVATTADGGLVAVAGSDDVVRVRAAGGAEVAALTGHTTPVTVLAFADAPSGATRLLGAALDGTALVWDVVRGTAVVLSGHDGPVRALVATASGRAVTGGDDGTLRAWDTTTGAQLATLQADAGVTGVAVTGPEELLAVTADGAVHGFVMTAGVPHDAVVLDRSGAPATAAGPAGPGRALATRADGTVELWWTGDEPGRVTLTGHGTAVRAAAANADGTLVATGDDHGRILLWDPAATAPAGDRPGLPEAVGAIVVAGGLIVSAARGTGELVALDLRTGDECWRCDGGPGPVWSDTAGMRIFTASGGTVTERYAATGLAAGSVEVPGRVLAGRGTLVVVGDGDRVAVADARTGRIYRSATTGAPVRRAALTPGGSTVLLGADTALAAWRPAAGDPVVVPLPGSMLAAVAIDDEGCHAVAADADGRAHVWTVGTDRVTTVRADPVQLCAATAAGGHRAVTAGTGGTALLWDLTRAAVLVRTPLDAPLTALAAAHGSVVAGDACGDTHCLDLLDGVSATGPTIPVPRDGAAEPEPAPPVVPEQAGAPEQGAPSGQPAPRLRRLLGLR